MRNLPIYLSVGLIALVVASIGGWIANVVKIVASIGDPLSAFFIARCVGVFFPPLGAVLGFL